MGTWKVKKTTFRIDEISFRRICIVSRIFLILFFFILDLGGVGKSRKQLFELLISAVSEGVSLRMSLILPFLFFEVVVW